MSGAAGKAFGIGAGRRRQMPGGPRLISEPLFDQPQVVQGVGVIRRVGQHPLERAARVVEPAQLEQGHPALVQGGREFGLGHQRRVDAAQGLAGPAQIDQRLPLEQGQPRHLFGIPARNVAAPAPRVLQPNGRPVRGGGKLVDLQVGGRFQRLRVVRGQGQRQLQGVARLVQAFEAHQRDRAVVVSLDRPRGLAGRLLRASQGSRVISLVEQVGRPVQQVGDRGVNPGRLILETAAQRPRRGLRGILVALGDLGGTGLRRRRTAGGLRRVPCGGAVAAAQRGRRQGHDQRQKTTRLARAPEVHVHRTVPYYPS